MSVGIPNRTTSSNVVRFPRPSAVPRYFPSPSGPAWARPAARTARLAPYTPAAPAVPRGVRVPRLPYGAGAWALAPLLVAYPVVTGDLTYGLSPGGPPEEAYWNESTQTWRVRGGFYWDQNPNGQFNYERRSASYYVQNTIGQNQPYEQEFYTVRGGSAPGWGHYWWYPGFIVPPGFDGTWPDQPLWTAPPVRLPQEVMPDQAPYAPGPTPGTAPQPRPDWRPRYRRAPTTRPARRPVNVEVTVRPDGSVGGRVLPGEGTRPPRGTRERKVRNPVMSALVTALDLGSEIVEIVEIWMDLAGVDFDDYATNWDAMVAMFGEDGAAWTVDPIDLLTEVWNNVQMDRPWGRFFGAQSEMMRDLGLSNWTSPAW